MKKEIKARRKADTLGALFDFNAEARSNKGVPDKYNEVTVFCNAHLRSFSGTAEKNIMSMSINFPLYPTELHPY